MPTSTTSRSSPRARSRTRSTPTRLWPRFAVVGEPDEKWVEAVTAFVVLKSAATAEELTAHVRQSLAGFTTPKRELRAQHRQLEEVVCR